MGKDKICLNYCEFSGFLKCDKYHFLFMLTLTVLSLNNAMVILMNCLDQHIASLKSRNWYYNYPLGIEVTAPLNPYSFWHLNR